MSLIYAIDHSADKLAIKGAPTEDSLTKKGPAEGFERVIVRDETELGNLDPALLLRIANFKTKGAPLTELPAVSEIWAMLSPPKRDPKKKIEKKSSEPLTGSADTAISSPPEGDSAKPDATKEAKVAKAKAKKASKKNGKGKGAKGAKTAKATNGLPREGSKAAKLLALISKPGGATFAEMKAATGWKEMRGTALTLARRAGKELTMIKDPDGKKAPRWAAK